MNLQNFESQKPYRCKLDWGVIGTKRAAAIGDIIVIVDILSFSTTTTYAVSQGAIVYPVAQDEDLAQKSKELHAFVAQERGKENSENRYSLSPQSFENIKAEENIILPSLNGSTCVTEGKGAGNIFIGSCLNISAVTSVLAERIQQSGNSVTIIACGEREKNSNEVRFAIEDYLGAGAILKHLHFDKSPEAIVCESAFKNCEGKLEELIWDSVSGRELREIGYEQDVKFAFQVNSVSAVPVLKGNAFIDFQSTTST